MYEPHYSLRTIEALHKINKEEELFLQSYDLIKTVIDNVSVGISIINKEHKLVFTNKK